jgi:hypothetical protein
LTLALSLFSQLWDAPSLNLVSVTEFGFLGKLNPEYFSQSMVGFAVFAGIQ